MALATTVLAATAATNPFFEYKNWKTPHGTYPFNEIHAEHYMPAFEEAMRQGLQEIDDIVNNPAAPTFANTIEAYEASGELLGIVAGCFYNLTNSETNDNLDRVRVPTSGDAITGALPEGRREILFEADIWMEDLAYVNNAINNSYPASGIVITLGIDHPVTLTLSGVRWMADGTLPSLIQDKQRQTIRLRAANLVMS